MLLLFVMYDLMIQSTSQPTWKLWGVGEVVCCQYNKIKSTCNIILQKKRSCIHTASREV